MCRCRCKLSHWAYICTHETNNNNNEIYLLEISMQFDTHSPLLYDREKLKGKKFLPCLFRHSILNNVHSLHFHYDDIETIERHQYTSL